MAQGAKGGGGGDRLGRRGVLKPPRPHPGSALGGSAGGPQGEGMGGGWATVLISRGRAPRGVPSALGERGRAPRLRPANRVLPPGGQEPPKRVIQMRCGFAGGVGHQRKRTRRRRLNPRDETQGSRPEEGDPEREDSVRLGHRVGEEGLSSWGPREGVSGRRGQQDT